MKELALINPENVSEEGVRNYATREAARAVVFDEDDNVALLYVANENYYKLPGGGIEENEEKKAALKRECLEEIGCKIEVVGEVGLIVEYRKIFRVKQISHCYLAKVVGKKVQPTFTDEESAKGFRQLWIPYYQALEAIQNNKASSVEGKDYIVPRDSIFLQTAGNLLHK